MWLLCLLPSVSECMICPWTSSCPVDFVGSEEARSRGNKKFRPMESGTIEITGVGGPVPALNSRCMQHEYKQTAVMTP